MRFGGRRRRAGSFLLIILAHEQVDEGDEPGIGIELSALRLGVQSPSAGHPGDSVVRERNHGRPLQLEAFLPRDLRDDAGNLGVGAGAALNGDKSKNKDGGGLSAKVSPTAALIIHNGTTRLISLKDQTAVMKAMDMVPDLVNRFTGKSKINDPEVDEAIDELKAEANKGKKK